MLDYKGQKKPAYYASQVLGRELGKCVYDFPMKGSDEVNYGYVYRNPETDRFVTVVWNGASEMAGTFRTRPGTVTVVSMTGEKKEIRTGAGRLFPHGLRLRPGLSRKRRSGGARENGRGRRKKPPPTASASSPTLRSW